MPGTHAAVPALVPGRRVVHSITLRSAATKFSRKKELPETQYLWGEIAAGDQNYDLWSAASTVARNVRPDAVLQADQALHAHAARGRNCYRSSNLRQASIAADRVGSDDTFSKICRVKELTIAANPGIGRHCR